MKYIRHFNSQEDYEVFIKSLSEDQKVLVGGPNSVNIHTGGSKPVPPAEKNVIWYAVNDGKSLFIDPYAFGDNITLLSNEYDESAGMYKAVFSGDVTRIGEYALANCESLISVNIPDSVTSIDESAFCQCPLLTSITIPDGVTIIGGYAFDQCTSLKSINIPSGVTDIGDHAFRQCTSLKSINIPSSVTDIYSAAFGQCTFDSFIYGGTVAQWNSKSWWSDWNEQMTITNNTIYCSDGEVKL